MPNIITVQMKRLLPGLCSMALLASATSAFADEKADPLLWMVNIDKLETRSGERDSYVLEAQAWLGYDLNKFLIKTQVEQEQGANEKAQLQFLYTKAVDPFWNLQLGMRYDMDPQPERQWAVIGFQGLSPYYVDIDTALFIGKSGRSELRFSAEYEQMITQRLVLRPELELNFSGKSDQRTGTGLVNSEFSMRLGYEVKREFSPYIGVVWEAKHGNTKRLARQESEETSETSVVVGVQGWF